MPDAAMPGTTFDLVRGLLHNATDVGAPKIAKKSLDKYADFYSAAVDIVNQRSQYANDATVTERNQRITQQLFDVAKMAQALHDAMLPSDFGG